MAGAVKQIQESKQPWSGGSSVIELQSRGLVVTVAAAAVVEVKMCRYRSYTAVAPFNADTK